MSEPLVLAARTLSFSYGAREVLSAVSLAVRQGERVAVAGPNGSGKTTLLKLLSGILGPSGGSVSVGGRPILALPPRERARRIAVVSQHVDPRLAFTVRDLVTMGRTPYIGLLGGQSGRDVAAVERAMRDTDVARLASRRFSELSGGEQQRVIVAAGLAQETDFLLLDEPTVHLDLQHQHELLELLSRLNRDRNIAVVAVLHDLNLASLFFDRVIVLSHGRLAAEGPPEAVLAEDVLQPIFSAPIRIVSHPTSRLPQVLLDP